MFVQREEDVAKSFQWDQSKALDELYQLRHNQQVSSAGIGKSVWCQAGTALRKQHCLKVDNSRHRLDQSKGLGKLYQLRQLGPK